MLAALGDLSPIPQPPAGLHVDHGLQAAFTLAQLVPIVAGLAVSLHWWRSRRSLLPLMHNPRPPRGAALPRDGEPGGERPPLTHLRS